MVRDDELPVGLVQYVVRKPYSSIFLYPPDRLATTFSRP